MKFYSSLKINVLSFFITIFIYIFITLYIPKVYKVISSYVYYKSQPNLIQEYEE